MKWKSTTPGQWAALPQDNKPEAIINPDELAALADAVAKCGVPAAATVTSALLDGNLINLVFRGKATINATLGDTKLTLTAQLAAVAKPAAPKAATGKAKSATPGPSA
jgi:hypothetical protein